MISLRFKFLCPALVRNVSNKAKKNISRPSKSPLVKNIEKLETYIKTLQKTVQKQISITESTHGDEAEAREVDITDFYRKLSTPASPALPAPQEILPAKLLDVLGLEVAVNLHDIPWKNVISGLVQSGRVNDLSISDINAILQSMPHGSRIQSGRELVDKLSKTPDRMTYDLLMDSYASLARASEALAIFDQSRASGLTPSLYSYAHLMKAFAVTKDLHRASALYQHMLSKGVEPNTIIVTSLIATCVRVRDTAKAFSIFDTMKYKSAESRPDAYTYSLMIYACSLDSQMSAERASDLFTEMTSNGLKPTKETFNALIHVYASRSEYFSEAWRMSELMQTNGIDMDKTTWHSLLSACVTNRDLFKARRLVMEMMKLGQTRPAWRPDAITFQTLFRAYAHGHARRSRVPQNVAEPEPYVTHGPDGDLWVHHEPYTSNDLLKESRNILDHILAERGELISTQLIDTYMTIAQAFDAPERFFNDWQTLYDSHRKKKYSYEIGLRASYDLTSTEILDTVWAERQQWRAQQNQEQLNSPSNKLEKNQFHDFEAFRLYIESLARLNRIAEAATMLDAVRDEYKFEKCDLKCFWTKAFQLGNHDAMELCWQISPDNRPSKRDPRFWKANMSTARDAGALSCESVVS